MTISTVISMIIAAVSEPEGNERRQLSNQEKVTLLGPWKRFCELQGTVIAVRSDVQGIVGMREWNN